MIEKNFEKNCEQSGLANFFSNVFVKMFLVNVSFVLSFYVAASVCSCFCCFFRRKHSRISNRIKIGIALILFAFWTIPLILWVFLSPNSLCHNAFEKVTMPVQKPWKCYWCTKPCENSVVLQPRTIFELQTYVASNDKLRVIGTGHSTNSLYCNNEALISVSHLCFIDTLQTTNNMTSVKIGSGCQIHYVQKELSRKGWHLQGFGAITDQQIGGSIMTSLHGMKSFYSFADHIQAITAVLANGELYKLTRENETLNAWPSSLGTLGIVIDVTFEIFPIRVMSCNHTVVDIRTLQNILTDDDYHGFHSVTIFPLQKHFRTKTCRINERNWTEMSYLLEDKIDEYKVALYESFVLVFTYMFSTSIPSVLASVLHDEYVPGDKSIELTTEFRTTAYRNPYFDQEYSVPVRECYNAIYKLQELMGKYQYNIIIRKVRSNSFWMSWAYGNDICAIGTSFIDYGRLDAYTSHINFRNKAERAIKQMNGSAHTGKLWISETSFWKTEQINKFNGYRQSLDPNGKFQNNYTKQLLGQGIRDDEALPNSLQFRMILWKTAMWCVLVVTLMLGCFSCATYRFENFHTHIKDVKLSVTDKAYPRSNEADSSKVSDKTYPISNKIDPLKERALPNIRQRERDMFIRYGLN